MAISNVKIPRITKIFNYIIKLTSYDGPTVSRTFVFAILAFGLSNCHDCNLKKNPDEFMGWFHPVTIQQRNIFPELFKCASVVLFIL